ncbi:ADP-ribose pyrophosphatase YjhB (NUDIX family) [Streptomyces sp. 3211.6]|uniref:NUDIX domain-containing protein n=1 Tax=Streptomyces sp. 3211.6 TaxID=1938845 RepID=UPI000EACE548|nr:NUDIX domain-containing protein [Streptomyces sp. 3211.6]RKT08232.1 ADP-ribose pyrophosphatase YjhB (NUDIX family) [Streptomyces sp. 3211.6]
MHYKPSLWPVSVKGVALDRELRVLLLRNERDEWELPGGRLEIGPAGGGSAAPDSSPAETLERELLEETGWRVTVGPQLEAGTWIYEPIPDRRVLILTYGCIVQTPDQKPVLSHEHKQLGLFHRREVPDLNMPEGYKRAIAAWYEQTVE